MNEYINKADLYSEIAKLEELARDRYLDTPSESPVFVRYQSQLNECTNLKHLIADTPAVDFGINLNRLKELAEADKDNRCLILPVKVGDILYYPYNNYISQLQVKYITICSKNTCIIYTEIIDGLNNIETNFNSKWIGETIFLTKEEAQKEADRRNMSIRFF